MTCLSTTPPTLSCTDNVSHALLAVPKPEPFPKPERGASPQRTFHSCQASPALSSPACTPLPPVPETPTIPTDLIATALGAPVGPSPALSPALALVVCMLPLPNTTSHTTSPSSAPLNMPTPTCQASSSQPRGPWPTHRLTTMPLALPSALPLPPLAPPPLSPLTPLVYEVLPPPAQSHPGPVSLPPLPTPSVHGLPPPTSLSIATTLLNPSGATGTKPNDRRAREQVDFSSIGNGDAHPLTEPQM